MRSFLIDIDEKYFNLIWRSLTERERTLLNNIEQEGDGLDMAAFAANDLVYLRLCKKELEQKARAAGFSDVAFSEDDGLIDLGLL